MTDSASGPPVLHLSLPRPGVPLTGLLRQLVTRLKPDHGDVSLRIRVYQSGQGRCRYHLTGCWRQPGRVHDTLAGAFDAMMDKSWS